MLKQAALIMWVSVGESIQTWGYCRLVAPLGAGMGGMGGGRWPWDAVGWELAVLSFPACWSVRLADEEAGDEWYGTS